MDEQPVSLSDKNQKFFDSLASASTRQPWMNDLVNQIQAEVMVRLEWIGLVSRSKQANSCKQTMPKVRMLDYACGAGELSRILFPYVDEAKGIDVSLAMVEAYNKKARAANISEDKMYAVQGNILDTTQDSEAETAFAEEHWFGFDLVTMSMALHHVAPPEDAVKKLVERLRDGGILVIIDWELDSIVHKAGHPRFRPGDHGNRSYHHGHHRAGMLEHARNVTPGSEHTITRPGFKKEEMEKMLADAGCEEVEFLEFSDGTRLGDGEQAVIQRLFLARGRKKDMKM